MNPSPRERLDRLGDLADVIGRGAAASADGRRAELHVAPGVGGEILGRAQVDSPVLDFLGDAGVGLDDQRERRQLDGLLDGAEQAVGTAAAVHSPGDRLPAAGRQRRHHPRHRLPGGSLVLIGNYERERKGYVGQAAHGQAAHRSTAARFGWVSKSTKSAPPSTNACACSTIMSSSIGSSRG